MKKNLFYLTAILFFNISQIPAQKNKKIIVNNDIQLIELQDSIFVHTSLHEMGNFGKVASNGLIVIKSGQAIMIDTPVDDEQTQQLTEFLKDSFKVVVTKFIPGHYHEDCLGGLNYLHSIGVESIANSLTITKCKELNLPVPKISFSDSLIFNFNNELIECRYFGSGHTIDNITVCIPGKQILFGGCLIKSLNSNNLGYIKEAIINQWDTTIKKLISKYPQIKIVVPGHGDFGDTKLLKHTIKLVEIQKNK